MIKINRMMHTGLIITDLARSRAFYEGLLGFQPNPNRPNFSFEGVWYDIGANQVHLMVVPNPYTEVQHPEHGGRDIHIEVEKAGIPYTMSLSGRAALFCRDPDGNALEFSAVK
jgi:glyoxylase I family protein